MSYNNCNRKRKRPNALSNDPRSKRRRQSAPVAVGRVEDGENLAGEEQKSLRRHITHPDIKKTLYNYTSTNHKYTPANARKKRAAILRNPKQYIDAITLEEGVDAIEAAVILDRRQRYLDSVGNTKRSAPPSYTNIFNATLITPDLVKKNDKIKEAVKREEVKWRIAPQTQQTFVADGATKKVTIYKAMALQNIYLKTGKIAKILKLTRYRGDRNTSPGGHVAKTMITYSENNGNPPKEIPYCFVDELEAQNADKVCVDDEKSEYLNETDGDTNNNVFVENNDEIKFRVGDIVKCDDAYYHILKIFQFKHISDDDDHEDIEVVDRFRLQRIDDDAVVDFDYDNDDKIQLIKKNISCIATSV